MVSAVVPGTGTVSFKYDPFGRRVYKSSPNFTGIFLYDNDNLIETTNGSGVEIAGYTQGINIDEHLSEFRSSAASYYEQDGLGSVTSLSNSAGALVNTYTYDSFGNLTGSTGTLRNPFQYTGREFDSETGLYEYRARYYDQSVGRFKSEDPIRFKGGINFYGYVGNNATNRTDPDGTAFKDCEKALEDLAKAQYEADKRLVQFLAHGDGEAQHAKQLGIALDRLNDAIAQVEKYCKCNPTIAAGIAAAVALAQQIAEALSQFCSETPCIANNNGYQFPGDKRVPLYTAHMDGDLGHGNTLG